jgi:hypothetical protein
MSPPATSSGMRVSDLFKRPYRLADLGLFLSNTRQFTSYSKPPLPATLLSANPAQGALHDELPSNLQKALAGAHNRVNWCVFHSVFTKNQVVAEPG